jgi:dTMP kinase
LSDGKVVISDRFNDATFAYQGSGGGVGEAPIETLDRVARQSVSPDLTILLDIDAAAGLNRAKRKGTDRMERKRLAYHRRVRKGYLERARRYPGRIKVIRVLGAIEDTQNKVRQEAERVIQRYSRA